MLRLKNVKNANKRSFSLIFKRKHFLTLFNILFHFHFSIIRILRPRFVQWHIPDCTVKFRSTRATPQILLRTFRLKNSPAIRSTPEQAPSRFTAVVSAVSFESSRSMHVRFATDTIFPGVPGRKGLPFLRCYGTSRNEECEFRQAGVESLPFLPCSSRLSFSEVSVADLHGKERGRQFKFSTARARTQLIVSRLGNLIELTTATLP